MPGAKKPGEWGSKDGKPAIAWYRPGIGAKGEPSVVQEVRTYASEEKRFDAQQRGLDPVGFSGGVKSVSDDDLCATCQSCQYSPGALSSCTSNWPGRQDEDGYVQECKEFKAVA